MRPKLLIANPSYDGRYQNLSAQLVAHRSLERDTYHIEQWSSALTSSFNQMWCAGLNMRLTDGITHFLLWHADVRPQGMDWLDILFQEMAMAGADVLSAIIPIKDDKGVTSTAFDVRQWQPLRVTQKQASELPETWTAENLLINTGLMLVDFQKPWVEQICFTVDNKIEKDPTGTWRSFFEPEDWNFSRQCRSLGVSMYVTRKIRVEHYGFKSYRSDDVWGNAVDPDVSIKDVSLTSVEVP